MNFTTCYEGTNLLSISYCNRSLKMLDNKRSNLLYARSNCTSMQEVVKSREFATVDNKISSYKSIREKLENDFKKASEYELIDFVVDQMIHKVEESKATRISISFFPESEYTVKIEINNIFSTELTLRKKVFEILRYSNEGHIDRMEENKVLSKFKSTAFLKEIEDIIGKTIRTKLPNVSFLISKFGY